MFALSSTSFVWIIFEIKSFDTLINHFEPHGPLCNETESHFGTNGNNTSSHLFYYKINCTIMIGKNRVSAKNYIRSM